MKAYLTMAAVCGALLAGPAQAQSWEQIEAFYSPQFNACMDNPNPAKRLQDAMADCMIQETALQDSRLEQSFGLKLAALQPDQQSALTADEKRWHSKREELCNDKASVVVGDWQKRLSFAECMLDATITRAIWLNDYKP